MVHNGIEHGMMAAYAEGLNILHRAASVHDQPRTPHAHGDKHCEASNRCLLFRFGTAGLASSHGHRGVGVAVMPRPDRNPFWLLGAVSVAVLACVGVVVVVAATGSLWALIIAVGVLVLAALSVVGDVDWSLGDSDRPRGRARGPRESSNVDRPLRPGPDYAGPKAPHRLVVMTSEPVSAERVLAAAASCSPASASPGSLGVMVVSPEGFGKPEVTNDEGHYRSALRAESETVASLRRRSVKAAGHVGDHNGAQALQDALVLFPAEHVLVFAHPHDVDAYVHAVKRANVRVPVDIIDVRPDAR
jgi:hypothetical protein